MRMSSLCPTKSALLIQNLPFEISNSKIANGQHPGILLKPDCGIGLYKPKHLKG